MIAPAPRCCRSRSCRSSPTTIRRAGRRRSGWSSPSTASSIYLWYNVAGGGAEPARRRRGERTERRLVRLRDGAARRGGRQYRQCFAHGDRCRPRSRAPSAPLTAHAASVRRLTLGTAAADHVATDYIDQLDAADLPEFGPNRNGTGGGGGGRIFDAVASVSFRTGASLSSLTRAWTAGKASGASQNLPLASGPRTRLPL